MRMRVRPDRRKRTVTAGSARIFVRRIACDLPSSEIAAYLTLGKGLCIPHECTTTEILGVSIRRVARNPESLTYGDDDFIGRSYSGQTREGFLEGEAMRLGVAGGASVLDQDESEAQARALA